MGAHVYLAALWVAFALSATPVTSDSAPSATPLPVLRASFSAILFEEVLKVRLTSWFALQSPARRALHISVVLDAGGSLGDTSLISAWIGRLQESGSATEMPVGYFHFVGPDALRATTALLELSAAERHRALSMLNLTVMPRWQLGSGDRPYVPSWDNIDFLGVFNTTAQSTAFPAVLKEWCVRIPDCGAPVFSPTSADSLTQSWYFATNASSFSAVSANAHMFYLFSGATLASRFGIASLTGTPILPPTSVPHGANARFTFEYISFNESPSDFAQRIARLLRVGTASFNITVDAQTPTSITFHFVGPNAVYMSQQLDAVPIDDLRANLGVIGETVVPIAGPPPSEAPSNTKWFLIGAGVVIVAIAAIVLLTIRSRRRRQKAGGTGSFDDGTSDVYINDTRGDAGGGGTGGWDHTGSRDRDLYAKLK